MSRAVGEEPGSRGGRGVLRAGLLLGLSMLFFPAGPAAPAANRPPGSASVVAVAPPAGRFLSRSRFLMGAPLAIEAAGTDADRAIEKAFEEVARLDGVLSNWHDSELTRLNDSAAASPVPCSEDLYRAVSAAVYWAGETEGAFDPTVEPIIRRLGVRGSEGRLPWLDGARLLPAVGEGAPDGGGGEEAVGLQAPVGWTSVRLDPAGRMVAFKVPGAALDLGGIGKGIALDAALRVLRDRGIVSALLDFGGQVLAFGPGPENKGWLVGVADPDDRGLPFGVLTLRDASLSTSGQGERGHSADAGRIGHIVDPRSRALAPFPGTVSVLSPDATTADALSTALLVMGPERGLRWAESHDQEVLFLFRDAQGRIVRRGSGRFAGKRD